MENSSIQEQFDIKKIRLIVGLGNIGRAYVNSRHNVGFDFTEKLAGTRRFLEEPKLKALMYMGDFEGEKKTFAEPTTMMNVSGESVSLIMKFYKIKAEEILVIHDDLDLRLGSYKLQFNKGPKIHNGILSIENRIGTSKFWRLRIGVDNREMSIRNEISGADYVLGHFKIDETKMLEDVFFDVRGDLLKQNNKNL
ncbi:MAG: aminoacyl-tRNA hydrolase [Candidatus Dojkabacteria bacterium]